MYIPLKDSQLLKRIQKEEKGMHVTLGVVVEIGNFSEKTGWKQTKKQKKKQTEEQRDKKTKKQ